MTVSSLQTFKRLILGLIIATGMVFNANAQSSPNPLFASDHVIKIQIEAPFPDLAWKASRSTEPYPAILRVQDGSPESYAITVAARGHSRRRKDTCKFPPLRVRFNERPQAPALFAKQKSLKLVTHCQRPTKNQDHAILEYSAYRLYNLITPQSLMVRLAEIEYINSENQKPLYTRYGFFIEDTDDAAARNAMKELDVERISSKQLNPEAALRITMFNYLISNLDWSLSRGLAGEDCCHNSKLVAPSKTTTENLIPIPYDFDQSGLVDAPYGVGVHASTPVVRTVRHRLYIGFCKDNDLAKVESQKILQKRPEIMALLKSLPGIKPRTRDKAVKFISAGFDNFSDPTKFKKRVISKCR